MPYGILPSDRPVAVESVRCCRCGRELAAGEGAVTIVSIAEKLLWLYCQICAGSSGYERRSD